MAKKLIVTVDNRKYKINKTKENELKKWLEDNAEIIVQTSEDLVIDIEETAGVEIEYKELPEEKPPKPKPSGIRKIKEKEEKPKK